MDNIATIHVLTYSISLVQSTRVCQTPKHKKIAETMNWAVNCKQATTVYNEHVYSLKAEINTEIVHNIYLLNSDF